MVLIRKPQGKNRQRTALETKHLLLDRKMSVAALARKIGRPRPSVSAAIHQGKFPRIMKEIQEALHG